MKEIIFSTVDMTSNSKNRVASGGFVDVVSTMKMVLAMKLGNKIARRKLL